MNGGGAGLQQRNFSIPEKAGVAFHYASAVELVYDRQGRVTGVKALTPTGRTPAAEMKYWMELIGMPGGPVRALCTELSEEKKKELRADLEATGIPAKVRANAVASPERQAA